MFQICTDIASTSIDQCKERYETLKRKNKNRRLFDAEFIVIDLGRVSFLDRTQYILHEVFILTAVVLSITDTLQ